MFEVDIKNVTERRDGKEEDQLGFGVLIRAFSSLFLLLLSYCHTHTPPYSSSLASRFL